MDSRDPVITSLQNDMVKNLVKLRGRRERDRQQLVIVEEPLVITRALDAGYPLTSVYYCPEQLTGSGRQVLARLQDDPGGRRFTRLAPPVMAKVSYRERPEGLLATGPQVVRTLADLVPPDPALLVVLEGVEKPGNLGAVLRVADGAGAHAVLVCGGGTDLFNPNVLRASRGACFALPTVAAPTDEVMAWLAGRGILRLATSPAAPAPYTHSDLTGPTALLLGTEHDGLTEGILQECDAVASIPMLGSGDSLNVATSCAVLLYEAARQRRLQSES